MLEGYSCFWWAYIILPTHSTKKTNNWKAKCEQVYIPPSWFQAMFNHSASDNLSPYSSNMKMSETVGSMNTIRTGHHFFGPNLTVTRAHIHTCPSWDKKVWDFKSTVTLALSRTLMLVTLWTLEIFSSNFRLLTEMSIAIVDHEPIICDVCSGLLQIQLSDAWSCFTGLFQIPLGCLVCQFWTLLRLHFKLYLTDIEKSEK